MLTHKKSYKLVKEKCLLVNGKKENVGLHVAEKRTETRDGLRLPVHYVTQRKNKSVNTLRQMPQMYN